jgi:DNA (cytosine-5)-methyltransferase 1
MGKGFIVTYRVFSLFSGCGGMDLGLIGGFKFLEKFYKKNPFSIDQAIDFDAKVVEMYNNNFSKKCTVQNILNLKNSEVVDHDIMIGGFPCQSFSIVAQNPKRLGYKDDRGKLFFEMCRILRDKQPRCFVAENVKGLLSANKGEAFKLIISSFRKCGYTVKYCLLNSKNYGIPQKRERIFIVGFKDKLDANKFQFPKPTVEKYFVPIKDILEEKQNIKNEYFFSEKAVQGLLKTKNYKSMNKGRAQNIEAPCNTVSSHLAKVSLNSTDPVLLENGRYRMFSPREVARIQSFPDSYKLTKSRTTNYKAIGNAVPPIMMWHVAQSVLNVFNNDEIVLPSS